jgi:hypothetical protein
MSAAPRVKSEEDALGTAHATGLPRKQPELPLFCIRPDNVNVKWLVGLLKEKGWTTRKEILAAANKRQSDHNVRWVRALVAAAGTDIVKGQKGFNHIENCKLEEILHAANQEISQGNVMLDYGIKLRARAHALVGGTPK